MTETLSLNCQNSSRIAKCLEDYSTGNDDLGPSPSQVFLLHASRFQKSRDLYRTFLSHYRPLRCVLGDIRSSYNAQKVLQAFRLQLLLQERLARNQVEVNSASLPAVKVAEGLKTLSSLEQNLLVLLSLLDSQSVVITGMTEILKTLEEAIEEEKVKKDLSLETRKQLIPEMNNLRETQQQEPVRSEVSADANEGAQISESNILNDPVALREEIERKRAGLTEVSTKLINWEANYADVVPATEYAGLLEVAEQNDKIHAKEKAKLDAILEIFNNFQNQANEAVADRNDFDEIHEELKNKATPRPSWSVLAKHIQNESQSEESSEAKKNSRSTFETLHLAIELLTGRKSGTTGGAKNESEEEELTDDSAVPAPARGTGTQIGGLVRRDAALLTHEILEARRAELQNAAKIEKPPSTFHTFFDDYLTKRFPWITIRAEVLTTLRNAYDVYGQSQPFLCLLMKILKLSTAENLLLDWQDEIARVRDRLQQESLKGDFPPGSLSYSALVASLDEIYPNRMKSEIEALGKSASPGGMDASWYFVQLEGLFAVTDEGYSTRFAQQLITTYEAERLSVVQSIIQALASDLGVTIESALREGDPTGDTDVSAAKFIVALTSCMTLSQENLAAILCWTYFTQIILPYTPSKGQQLLRYIQENLRRSVSSGEGSDDVDDNEEDQALDAAVQELTGFSFNASQENLKPDSRKRLLQPVRTIIERLQGCPLSWMQESSTGL